MLFKPFDVGRSVLYKGKDSQEYTGKAIVSTNENSVYYTIETPEGFIRVPEHLVVPRRVSSFRDTIKWREKAYLNHQYKPGDQVRIVDKRTSTMNNIGRMDKYLGQVITLGFMHRYDMHDYSYIVHDKENGKIWYFTEDMIAGPVIPKMKTFDTKLPTI